MAVLAELLHKSREFGCEYSTHLSNHLPMALIALDRLGGSDDQLRAFYAHHIKGLQPRVQESVTINRENWLLDLGRHQLNSAYHQFFSSELAMHGLPTTLGTYLPKLIPGLSGAAFHPLIRMAYALEAGNEWEIAESLASWAMAYLELGPAEGSPQGRKPGLKSLHTLAARAKDMGFSGENIFERMEKAASTELYKKFLAEENLSSATLKDISDAAIWIYLSTDDNFIGLHCVTAAHAFRVVFSRVHCDARYLWQGITAGYLVMEVPPIEESEMLTNLPSWEGIFEAGCESTNEHVIKFIYTAHEEWKFYGSPLYQLAAAKKAGLKI